MLLPYATVKPHDAAACPQCSRRAPGHQVCINSACPGRAENNGGGRVATRQVARHATDQEYAALPLAHIPIDGYAVRPVFMCDYCAEDAGEPFCDHPAPQPAACPTCGAHGDPMTAPCLKRDGKTPLHFTHADRPVFQPDRCAHAHRADCPIFTGCPCQTDDEPPVRPPHPAQNHIDGPGPDTSALLFEPELAQALLLHHGVHWWQVRSVASCYTQDNKPAIRADVAQLDDAGHLRYDVHGHEVRQEIVIVIEAPQQG